MNYICGLVYGTLQCDNLIIILFVVLERWWWYIYNGCSCNCIWMSSTTEFHIVFLALRAAFTELQHYNTATSWPELLARVINRELRHPWLFRAEGFSELLQLNHHNSNSVVHLVIWICLSHCMYVLFTSAQFTQLSRKVGSNLIEDNGGQIRHDCSDWNL